MTKSQIDSLIFRYIKKSIKWYVYRWIDGGFITCGIMKNDLTKDSFTKENLHTDIIASFSMFIKLFGNQWPVINLEGDIVNIKFKDVNHAFQYSDPKFFDHIDKLIQEINNSDDVGHLSSKSLNHIDELINFRNAVQ